MAEVTTMRADEYATLLLSGLFLVGMASCKDKKLKPDDENKQKTEKAAQKKKKQKPKAVEPDPSKPATYGLLTVDSDKPVDKVVEAFKKRLEKARSVSIIADVDHGKNAESVEMKFPATSLLLFSNPNFEIPFVRKQVSAGLDLPQRLLFWEKSGGGSRVTMTAPSYVAKRHGIERLDLFLSRMEKGMANPIEEAADTQVPKIPKRPDIGIENGDGIITRESNNGVSDTFEKLVGILEDNENIQVFATVDYQLAAKSVNQDLRPAKLVVFGNPKLGTKLMNKSRTVAVDLPQKMFVYETKDAEILIAFNDPAYLAERHGIEGASEVVKKIDKALKKFAAKAAKEISP